MPGFGLVVALLALLFAWALVTLEHRGDPDSDMCMECGEKASPVGANRCAECVLGD